MMKVQLLLNLILFAATSQAVTHLVSTSAQLDDLMKENVNPGDVIILRPGTYSGSFYSMIDGTASNPITIRSQFSDHRKAVINGQNIYSFYSIPIWIFGNYWTIQDLDIQNGNKGVVFDNAYGGKVIGCDVHNIGEEAIHVRDGSSNCLIEGNNIYDTGRSTAEWGEGIYVGTDKGQWSQYNSDVGDVMIRGNTIGPNVRAEGIDVKEGSHDVIIENNVFNAAGMSGVSHVDSFIDLKGAKSIVQFNTFNQNNGPIEKGIAILDRGVRNSGSDHVIMGNTFNMNNADKYIVRAHQNTDGVVVMNNVRYPAGNNYAGGLSEVQSVSQLPSWYPRSNVDATASRTIYANQRVHDEYWLDQSSGGSFQTHYDDGGSHKSTYKADLGVNGKVRFTATLADLTGTKDFKFFARSMASDVMLKLRVIGRTRTVSGTVTPSGSWSDNSLEFSWWFLEGADVTAVEFENTSNKAVTVLFDDLRFVE